MATTSGLQSSMVAARVESISDVIKGLGVISTMIDDKTKIQALALANDCYKYITVLTTNGVVIRDAIKFVQTNKEKLMSRKEDEKESEEPDYNEDSDQLEEEQEEETGEPNEKETTNQVF